MSKEKIFSKLNERFPIKDWEILTEYKNMHFKLEIKTKYGNCKVTPQDLLRSTEISIRSAVNKTEYFINRYNDLFKHDYDFSKFIFTKAKEHSTIICKKHGEFRMKPNNLMSGHGCNECGNLKISEKLKCTTNTFIIKSNIIHDDFYIYNNTIYGENNKSKVIITCPIHGDFYQTISDHLSGYGCKECGKIIISKATSKIQPHLRKMTEKIRALISSSYRRKSYKKNSPSAEILGCSWDEFRIYLEDNLYNYKVDCSDMDLDHIIPISSAKTENELHLLNHYSNFQLLPRIYNQHIKRINSFNKEHFEKWLIETEYNKC